MCYLAYTSLWSISLFASNLNIENELTLKGSPLDPSTPITSYEANDIFQASDNVVEGLNQLQKNLFPILNKPYLQHKLIEYLKSSKHQISPENKEICLKFLKNGPQDISKEQLSVVATFLQDIQKASIQTQLGLSIEHIKTIQQTQDKIKSHDKDMLEIAKQMKSLFFEKHNMTPQEMEFRNRTHLVNPEGTETEFIVNTLLQNNDIDTSMSNTEVAKKVMSYIQNNFKYKAEQLDKNGKQKDHWQSVRETINKGTGDCEDLSILYASVLMNALGRKGYSKTQISSMVKISAGFVIDSNGSKFGHTIVKFNNQQGLPPSNLAMDVTTSSGVFNSEEFPFESLFEFNNTCFEKFAEISEDFSTAFKLGDINDERSIIYKIMQKSIELSGKIDSETGITTQDGILQTALETPKMIDGDCYRKIDYYNLIPQADGTIVRDLVNAKIDEATHYINIESPTDIHSKTGAAVDAARANPKNYRFYKLITGTEDFGFYKVEKTIIEYGLGAKESTLPEEEPRTIHTAEIIPEKFDEYINKTRDLLNQIIGLFHLANCYAESLNNAAREIHEGVSQETQESHKEERKASAKQIGKFAKNINDFQEKASSAVLQASDQVFSFINNFNDAQFSKAFLATEDWGRGVFDGNGFWSFIGNLFIGSATEALDSFFGTFTEVRARNKRALNILKKDIYSKNLEARNTLSMKMLPRIALWSSNSSAFKLEDRLSHKENGMYFEQDIQKMMKDSLVHTDEFATKSKMYQFLRDSKEQTDQVMRATDASEIVGLEKNFENLKIGEGRESSLDGNVFSAAEDKDGGEASRYFDFNMEKGLLFQEYVMEFQNMVRSALMFKQIIIEHKRQIAKEISGGQDTVSIQQVQSAATGALDKELQKQQQFFDQYHNNMIQLHTALNDYIQSVVDLTKATVTMGYKLAKTTTNIVGFIKNPALAAPLAATRALASVSPVIPATTPSGTAPNLAHSAEVTEQTKEWQEYYTYMLSSAESAGLETVYASAVYGLEKLTPEWMHPKTLHHNSERYSRAATNALLDLSSRDEIQYSSKESDLFNNLYAKDRDGKSVIGKFYSKTSRDIMLQARLELLQDRPEGQTFEHGGLTSSSTIPSMPPDFIVSQQDGKYAIDQTELAQKTRILTEEYHNKIRAVLNILMALFEVVEGSIADALGVQKSGVTNKMENQVSVAVQFESSVLAAIKQELNTYLAGLNKSAEKHKTITNSLIEAGVAAAELGMVTTALPYIPKVSGLPGHYLPTAIEREGHELGKGIYQGLVLDKDIFETNRINRWGPYASAYAMEYYDYRMADKKEPGVDMATRDLPPTPIANATTTWGFDEFYQETNAYDESSVLSVKENLQSQNILAQNYRSQANSENGTITDRTVQLAPFYLLDEKEKKHINDLYYREVAKTDSELYEDSRENYEVFEDLNAMAWDYKWLNFESVSKTQERLNKIFMIRVMLLTIIKALNAKKAQTLKQMFGVPSAINSIIDKTMSQADSFNQAQLSSMSDLVQEFQQRIAAHTQATSAVITADTMTTVLISFMALVYGASGPIDSKASLKKAQKDIVKKGVAKTIMQITANAAIATFSWYATSQKSQPSVNSEVLDSDEETDDTVLDDIEKQAKAKKRREFEKEAKRKGLDKEQSRKFVASKKDKINLAGKKERAKAKETLAAKREERGGEQNSNFFGVQGQNDATTMSARGQYVMNPGMMTKAKTRLNRKFEKLKLLQEITVAKGSAGVEETAEMAGNEADNSFKKAMGALSLLKQSETAMLDHIQAHLQQLVDAKNRYMDRVKSSITSGLGAGLSKLAKHARKKLQETAKKDSDKTLDPKKSLSEKIRNFFSKKSKETDAQAEDAATADAPAAKAEAAQAEAIASPSGKLKGAYQKSLNRLRTLLTYLDEDTVAGKMLIQILTETMLSLMAGAGEQAYRWNSDEGVSEEVSEDEDFSEEEGSGSFGSTAAIENENLNIQLQKANMNILKQIIQTDVEAYKEIGMAGVGQFKGKAKAAALKKGIKKAEDFILRKAERKVKGQKEAGGASKTLQNWATRAADRAVSIDDENLEDLGAKPTFKSRARNIGKRVGGFLRFIGLPKIGRRKLDRASDTTASSIQRDQESIDTGAHLFALQFRKQELMHRAAAGEKDIMEEEAGIISRDAAQKMRQQIETFKPTIIEPAETATADGATIAASEAAKAKRAALIKEKEAISTEALEIQHHGVLTPEKLQRWLKAEGLHAESSTADADIAKSATAIIAAMQSAGLINEDGEYTKKFKDKTAEEREAALGVLLSHEDIAIAPGIQASLTQLFAKDSTTLTRQMAHDQIAALRERMIRAGVKHQEEKDEELDQDAYDSDFIKELNRLRAERDLQKLMLELSSSQKTELLLKREQQNGVRTTTAYEKGAPGTAGKIPIHLQIRSANPSVDADDDTRYVTLYIDPSDIEEIDFSDQASVKEIFGSILPEEGDYNIALLSQADARTDHTRLLEIVGGDEEKAKRLLALLNKEVDGQSILSSQTIKPATAAEYQTTAIDLDDEKLMAALVQEMDGANDEEKTAAAKQQLANLKQALLLPQGLKNAIAGEAAASSRIKSSARAGTILALEDMSDSLQAAIEISFEEESFFSRLKAMSADVGSGESDSDVADILRTSSKALLSASEISEMVGNRTDLSEDVAAKLKEMGILDENGVIQTGSLTLTQSKILKEFIGEQLSDVDQKQRDVVTANFESALNERLASGNITRFTAVSKLISLSTSAHASPEDIEKAQKAAQKKLGQASHETRRNTIIDKLAARAEGAEATEAEAGASRGVKGFIKKINEARRKSATQALIDLKQDAADMEIESVDDLTNKEDMDGYFATKHSKPTSFAGKLGKIAKLTAHFVLLRFVHSGLEGLSKDTKKPGAIRRFIRDGIEGKDTKEKLVMARAQTAQKKGINRRARQKSMQAQLERYSHIKGLKSLKRDSDLIGAGNKLASAYIEYMKGDDQSSKKRGENVRKLNEARDEAVQTLWKELAEKNDPNKTALNLIQSLQQATFKFQIELGLSPEAAAKAASEMTTDIMQSLIKRSPESAKKMQAALINIGNDSSASKSQRETAGLILSKMPSTLVKSTQKTPSGARKTDIAKAQESASAMIEITSPTNSDSENYSAARKNLALISAMTETQAQDFMSTLLEVDADAAKHLLESLHLLSTKKNTDGTSVASDEELIKLDAAMQAISMPILASLPTADPESADTEATGALSPAPPPTPDPVRADMLALISAHDAARTTDGRSRQTTELSTLKRIASHAATDIDKVSTPSEFMDGIKSVSELRKKLQDIGLLPEAGKPATPSEQAIALVNENLGDISRILIEAITGTDPDAMNEALSILDMIKETNDGQILNDIATLISSALNTEDEAAGRDKLPQKQKDFLKALELKIKDSLKKHQSHKGAAALANLMGVYNATAHPSTQPAPEKSLATQRAESQIQQLSIETGLQELLDGLDNGSISSAESLPEIAALIAQGLAIKSSLAEEALKKIAKNFATEKQNLTRLFIAVKAEVAQINKEKSSRIDFENVLSKAIDEHSEKEELLEAIEHGNPAVFFKGSDDVIRGVDRKELSGETFRALASQGVAGRGSAKRRFVQLVMRDPVSAAVLLNNEKAIPTTLATTLFEAAKGIKLEAATIGPAKTFFEKFKALIDEKVSNLEDISSRKAAIETRISDLEAANPEPGTPEHTELESLQADIASLDQLALLKQIQQETEDHIAILEITPMPLKSLSSSKTAALRSLISHSETGLLDTDLKPELTRKADSFLSKLPQGDMANTLKGLIESVKTSEGDMLSTALDALESFAHNNQDAIHAITNFDSLSDIIALATVIENPGLATTEALLTMPETEVAQFCAKPATGSDIDRDAESQLTAFLSNPDIDYDKKLQLLQKLTDTCAKLEGAEQKQLQETIDNLMLEFVGTVMTEQNPTLRTADITEAEHTLLEAQKENLAKKLETSRIKALKSSPTTEQLAIALQEISTVIGTLATLGIEVPDDIKTTYQNTLLQTIRSVDVEELKAELKAEFEEPRKTEVARLQARVDEQSTLISDTQSEIADLEKQKKSGTPDQITALQTQIDTLETTLSAQKTELTARKTTVKTLEDSPLTLSDDQQAQLDRLSTIETEGDTEDLISTIIASPGPAELLTVFETTDPRLAALEISGFASIADIKRGPELLVAVTAMAELEKQAATKEPVLDAKTLGPALRNPQILARLSQTHPKLYFSLLKSDLIKTTGDPKKPITTETIENQLDALVPKGFVKQLADTKSRIEILEARKKDATGKELESLNKELEEAEKHYNQLKDGITLLKDTIAKILEDNPDSTELQLADIISNIDVGDPKSPFLTELQSSSTPASQILSTLQTINRQRVLLDKNPGIRECLSPRVSSDNLHTATTSFFKGISEGSESDKLALFELVSHNHEVFERMLSFSTQVSSSSIETDLSYDTAAGESAEPLTPRQAKHVMTELAKRGIINMPSQSFSGEPLSAVEGRLKEIAEQLGIPEADRDNFAKATHSMLSQSTHKTEAQIHSLKELQHIVASQPPSVRADLFKKGVPQKLTICIQTLENKSSKGFEEIAGSADAIKTLALEQPVGNYTSELQNIISNLHNNREEALEILVQTGLSRTAAEELFNKLTDQKGSSEKKLLNLTKLLNKLHQGMVPKAVAGQPTPASHPQSGEIKKALKALTTALIHEHAVNQSIDLSAEDQTEVKTIITSFSNTETKEMVRHLPAHLTNAETVHRLETLFDKPELLEHTGILSSDTAIGMLENPATIATSLLSSVKTANTELATIKQKIDDGDATPETAAKKTNCERTLAKLKGQFTNIQEDLSLEDKIGLLNSLAADEFATLGSLIIPFPSPPSLTDPALLQTINTLDEAKTRALLSSLGINGEQQTEVTQNAEEFKTRFSDMLDETPTSPAAQTTSFQDILSSSNPQDIAQEIELSFMQHPFGEKALFDGPLSSDEVVTALFEKINSGEVKLSSKTLKKLLKSAKFRTALAASPNTLQSGELLLLRAEQELSDKKGTTEHATCIQDLSTEQLTSFFKAATKTGSLKKFKAQIQNNKKTQAILKQAFSGAGELSADQAIEVMKQFASSPQSIANLLKECLPDPPNEANLTTFFKNTIGNPKFAGAIAQLTSPQDILLILSEVCGTASNPADKLAMHTALKNAADSPDTPATSKIAARRFLLSTEVTLDAETFLDVLTSLPPSTSEIEDLLEHGYRGLCDGADHSQKLSQANLEKMRDKLSILAQKQPKLFAKLVNTPQIQRALESALNTPGFEPLIKDNLASLASNLPNISVTVDGKKPIPLFKDGAINPAMFPTPPDAAIEAKLLHILQHQDPAIPMATAIKLSQHLEAASKQAVETASVIQQDTTPAIIGTSFVTHLQEPDAAYLLDVDFEELESNPAAAREALSQLRELLSSKPTDAATRLQRATLKKHLLTNPTLSNRFCQLINNPPEGSLSVAADLRDLLISDFMHSTDELSVEFAGLALQIATPAQKKGVCSKMANSRKFKACKGNTPQHLAALKDLMSSIQSNPNINEDQKTMMLQELASDPEISENVLTIAESLVQSGQMGETAFASLLQETIDQDPTYLRQGSSKAKLLNKLTNSMLSDTKNTELLKTILSNKTKFPTLSKTIKDEFSRMQTGRNKRKSIHKQYPGFEKLVKDTIADSKNLESDPLLDTLIVMTEQARVAGHNVTAFHDIIIQQGKITADDLTDIGIDTSVSVLSALTGRPPLIDANGNSLPQNMEYYQDSDFDELFEGIEFRGETKQALLDQIHSGKPITLDYLREIVKEPATPNDLMDALEKGLPNILHPDGHITADTTIDDLKSKLEGIPLTDSMLSSLETLFNKQEKLLKATLAKAPDLISSFTQYEETGGKKFGSSLRVSGDDFSTYLHNKGLPSTVEKRITSLLRENVSKPMLSKMILRQSPEETVTYLLNPNMSAKKRAETIHQLLARPKGLQTLGAHQTKQKELMTKILTKLMRDGLALPENSPKKPALQQTLLAIYSEDPTFFEELMETTSPIKPKTIGKRSWLATKKIAKWVMPSLFSRTNTSDKLVTKDHALWSSTSIDGNPNPTFGDVAADMFGIDISHLKKIETTMRSITSGKIKTRQDLAMQMHTDGLITAEALASMPKASARFDLSENPTSQAIADMLLLSADDPKNMSSILAVAKSLDGQFAAINRTGRQVQKQDHVMFEGTLKALATRAAGENPPLVSSDGSGDIALLLTKTLAAKSPTPFSMLELSKTVDEMLGVFKQTNSETAQKVADSSITEQLENLSTLLRDGIPKDKKELQKTLPILNALFGDDTGLLDDKKLHDAYKEANPDASESEISEFISELRFHNDIMLLEKSTDNVLANTLSRLSTSPSNSALTAISYDEDPEILSSSLVNSLETAETKATTASFSIHGNSTETDSLKTLFTASLSNIKTADMHNAEKLLLTQAIDALLSEINQASPDKNKLTAIATRYTQLPAAGQKILDTLLSGLEAAPKAAKLAKSIKSQATSIAAKKAGQKTRLQKALRTGETVNINGTDTSIEELFKTRVAKQLGIKKLPTDFFKLETAFRDLADIAKLDPENDGFNEKLAPFLPPGTTPATADENQLKAATLKLIEATGSDSFKATFEETIKEAPISTLADLKKAISKTILKLQSERLIALGLASKDATTAVEVVTKFKETFESSKAHEIMDAFAQFNGGTVIDVDGKEGKTYPTGDHNLPKLLMLLEQIATPAVDPADDSVDDPAVDPADEQPSPSPETTAATTIQAKWRGYHQRLTNIKDIVSTLHDSRISSALTFEDTGSTMPREDSLIEIQSKLKLFVPNLGKEKVTMDSLTREGEEGTLELKPFAEATQVHTEYFLALSLAGATQKDPATNLPAFDGPPKADAHENLTKALETIDSILGTPESTKADLDARFPSDQTQSMLDKRAALSQLISQLSSEAVVEPPAEGLGDGSLDDDFEAPIGEHAEVVETRPAPHASETHSTYVLRFMREWAITPQTGEFNTSAQGLLYSKFLEPTITFNSSDMTKTIATQLRSAAQYVLDSTDPAWLDTLEGIEKTTNEKAFANLRSICANIDAAFETETTVLRDQIAKYQRELANLPPGMSKPNMRTVKAGRLFSALKDQFTAGSSTHTKALALLKKLLPPTLYKLDDIHSMPNTSPSELTAIKSFFQGKYESEEGSKDVGALVTAYIDLNRDPGLNYTPAICESVFDMYIFDQESLRGSPALQTVYGNHIDKLQAQLDLLIEGGS